METIRLGKYEIRGTVGRGAVGVVYEAWDPMMARTVAIKALPLHDLDEDGKEQYARFKREAQAAARLHHPNIVSAFDYGETESSAYIVMEFLPGPSLKSVLGPREPLSLERIGTIMQGLLAGLQHSHSRGVVHRDIKPANIVFSADGEVKITDFGIAHLDTSGITRAGSVLGTPAYMAPEQVLGDPVDGRTDLFSAGVVLYEMLTGRRPFEGSTSSIMHKIVNLHPPQPSSLAATLSARIDAVIAKALAKDPHERYQTANDFDAALRAALAHAQAPAVEAARDSETTVAAHRPGTLRARRNEPLQPRAAERPVVPASTPHRRQWPLLLAGTGVVGIAAVAWFALAGKGGPMALATFNLAAPQSARSHETAPPSVASAASQSREHAQTQKVEAASPAPTAAVPPQAEKAAANGGVGAGAAPPEKPTDDSLQSLQDKVQTIVASAPCSLVTAEISKPNKVRLQGVTALGEASGLEIRASLQRAIRAAAPDAEVSWSTQRIEGPYCPVLEALGSVPRGDPRFRVALSLPGNRRHLAEGAVVPINAAMPSPAATLMLDLFTADGQVHHLHAGPIGAAPLTLRPGKPDGDQLLSAVIMADIPSEERRPAQETATAYLTAFKSGLSRAAAGDARVAVDALPIVVDPH